MSDCIPRAGHCSRSAAGWQCLRLRPTYPGNWRRHRSPRERGAPTCYHSPTGATYTGTTMSFCLLHERHSAGDRDGGARDVASLVGYQPHVGRLLQFGRLSRPLHRCCEPKVLTCSSGMVEGMRDVHIGRASGRRCVAMAGKSATRRIAKSWWREPSSISAASTSSSLLPRL